MTFHDAFDEAPTVFAHAPGRVNLIGEHTDYSDGFVLPLAIPLGTTVELRPRADGRVRVGSAVLRDAAPSTFALGTERRSGGWSDYVRGVTDALRKAAIEIRGFDAWFASTIPIGAGLSSSAALSVALLRGLRRAFALPIDDVTIARLARVAENDLVGAPVGIMDPMACSLADEKQALFLDTRTLAYERIPVPDALEVVVIDSGIAHQHASGDYGTRRAETERAAQLLGVAKLRDVGIDALATIARLPAPLDRRARHVVTENQRVLDAVAALRGADLGALKELFAASHASMRDDFEVSVAEVDVLVERAQRLSDVVGARLTGGGFGGSIVVLARSGTASNVAERTLEGSPSAKVLVPLPTREARRT